MFLPHYCQLLCPAATSTSDAGPGLIGGGARQSLVASTVSRRVGEPQPEANRVARLQWMHNSSIILLVMVALASPPAKKSPRTTSDSERHRDRRSDRVGRTLSKTLTTAAPDSGWRGWEARMREKTFDTSGRSSLPARGADHHHSASVRERELSRRHQALATNTVYEL
jgi:hypothetical protein